MRRGQFRNGAASFPARSRRWLLSCTCTNARFAAIVPNRPALVRFAESFAAPSLLQHNRLLAGLYALFRIDGLLTCGTGGCWYCCVRCNEKQSANTRTITSSIFSIFKHANDARPSLERGGGPHDIRLRRAIPRWQVGCSRFSPPAAFDRSSVS